MTLDLADYLTCVDSHEREGILLDRTLYRLCDEHPLHSDIGLTLPRPPTRAEVRELRPPLAHWTIWRHGRTRCRAPYWCLESRPFWQPRTRSNPWPHAPDGSVQG